LSDESKIKLKKWQRVYVNRSLNMGSIKAIGFDMDHTLAIYNRENFEALAFRVTLDKFLNAGYPEELSQLSFDPQSVIRGLLVDRQRGNLLKVDGHKYVKIAFHGHMRLPKEKRHRLYNAESYKAEEFISLDTFFSLSEVQLFVEIVDFMNNNPGKISKTFGEVYDDLRTFIDESHRDGSIKNVVVNTPQDYFIRDENLQHTLERLIEGGKTLFLLTNSDWEYTQSVMSYILPSTNEILQNWRDYFTYTIVGAGKPSFFTGAQPFYEVITESNLLKQHSGPLDPSKVYQGGNANLLQSLMHYRGDEILYVGDHVYGDIIRSKGLYNWRTMLVVEELEHELPTLEEVKSLTNEIVTDLQKRERFDEELQILHSKIKTHVEQITKATERSDLKRANFLEKEKVKLEEKQKNHEKDLQAMDEYIREKIELRECKIHPIWGELMKVGLEKSRFAQQLETYACLYTSKVSNLRFYSPFKRFTSPHEILPHDL